MDQILPPELSDVELEALRQIGEHPATPHIPRVGWHVSISRVAVAGRFKQPLLKPAAVSISCRDFLPDKARRWLAGNVQCRPKSLRGNGVSRRGPIRRDV